MQVAILQPYFFPYIGYFQLISSTDLFIFYDDVQYVKRGWMNRNRVLAGDRPKYITIPCRKGPRNQVISEVVHAMEAETKEKLLNRLKSYYGQAPFFREVFPMVNEVLRTDSNYLADLSIASVRRTCEYLGISARFKESSKEYENAGLERSDRLIDICKREGGDTYINAPGGKQLYEKSYFRERGMDLKFIKPGEIVYEQFGNEFVPWLSIIDVMMFNSPEKVRDFLQCYELE